MMVIQWACRNFLIATYIFSCSEMHCWTDQDFSREDIATERLVRQEHLAIPAPEDSIFASHVAILAEKNLYTVLALVWTAASASGCMQAPCQLQIHTPRISTMDHIVVPWPALPYGCGDWFLNQNRDGYVSDHLSRLGIAL